MELLTAIIKKHGEWSEKTFTNGTALGALMHLKREIGELEADITGNALREQTLVEYADCLGCLADSWRRHGYTTEEITNAFYLKLVKNQGRTWIDNGDGSYRLR